MTTKPACVSRMVLSSLFDILRKAEHVEFLSPGLMIRFYRLARHNGAQFFALRSRTIRY